MNTFEENFGWFRVYGKEEIDRQHATTWIDSLSQEELLRLWEHFGDTAVYDQDAVDEMAGEYTLPQEQMENDTIDEDFVIWPRGTPRMTIWQWFDNRFTTGLVNVMHVQ